MIVAQLLSPLNEGHAQGLRDSAGIIIVTSVVPRTPPRAFQLSARPQIDIGGTAGDARYDLDRVQTAMRLRDGRVVIANTGAFDLRFFDASGRFTAATSGKGSGPGEFSSTSFHAFRMPGDSVLAFESPARRFHLFDPRGRLVEAHTFEIDSDWGAAEPGRATVRAGAVFADGTLLLQRSLRELGGPVSRDSSRYYRITRTGQILNTIGDFVGGALTSHGGEQRRGAGGTNANISFTSRLKFETVWRPSNIAVFKDALLMLDDRSNDIRLFAQNGKLLRIVRTDQRALASYPPIPVAANVPEVRLGFVADAAGRIWVENYRTPADTQPRWTVFTAEGALLGEVLTPPRLQVREIGRDYILGVWRDPDEVEHVRLYTFVGRGAR